METITVTSRNLNRRVFVKDIGFVTLGFLLATTMGGCESCKEQIQNRPTRRRLRTGSAEVDADIATYAQAVTLMKALPASDPRSWASQAAIHGTAGVSFNFCQHGTNHFFSWHRAYLAYFERICQELTGNKNWGLPYWNWNKNPDIHPEYLIAGSSLFSTRTRTTMLNHVGVSDDNLDNIFLDGNFFSFSSQLEGSPHNNVHTHIGGTFGGFGSATDPIFWNHHCMVDYCWYKWNVDIGNDNTNDATWIGTKWTHFVDGQGNPAESTAGITTLLPLLTYQYECSNIGTNQSCLNIRTRREFQIVEDRIKKGRDIKFDIRRRIPIAERAPIAIGRPFSTELRAEKADLDMLFANDMSNEFVFAGIDFARYPKDSDFYVRVFINLPGANPETSTDDPHFAGSFSFFGTDTGNQGGHGDHSAHQPKFLVNVSPAIQELRKRNELNPEAPFSVQLVPVANSDSGITPDDTLLLENISLLITPVVMTIKSE